MSDYFDKFDRLTREQKSRLYEIENDNSFDEPEEIACPYCKYLASLDYTDVGYEQDDETNIHCDNCEKDFTAIANVEYSWSTAVPDEEAMEILEKELEDVER